MKKTSVFVRLTLPVSLLLALLLAVFPAATAFAAAPAAAQTFTFNDKGVYTFTDVVPCGTNAPYDITSTYTNVAHFTINSNGEYETFTEQGQVVAVPQSGVGPTYTGHYTIWDGGSTRNQNGGFTSTFSVSLKGSDGSTVHYTEVAHWSVSATGMVVSFDKPVCH